MMRLEKLKALLQKGSITQEEFNEMAALLPNDPEDKPEDGGTTPEADPHEADQEAALNLKIQAAVDRVANKLGNDNKILKDQLIAERKKNLSAEELKKVEMKEKEDEIAEREKALAEKENRLYAIKAIKTAGLDDGSDVSLDLVDFVMGADTTVIDTKIKAFDVLFKKIVKTKVDELFKANGKTPENPSTWGNKTNPYMKATFNMTEQMKLETENPKLAKQLQALAWGK